MPNTVRQCPLPACRWRDAQGELWDTQFNHHPSNLWEEGPAIPTTGLNAFFAAHQQMPAAFILPHLPSDLAALVQSLDAGSNCSLSISAFLSAALTTVCLTPFIRTIRISSGNVLRHEFGLIHPEPPRRTALIATTVPGAGNSTLAIIDRPEVSLVWIMHEAVHAHIYGAIARGHVPAAMESDERWSCIAAKVLYEYFASSSAGFDPYRYGYGDCVHHLADANRNLQLPSDSTTCPRPEDQRIANGLPTFIADRL